MKPFIEQVGSAIRSIRGARKYTLEKLAERSDLSPSYLSDVERGERNLTLQNLRKIAKGLDIPLYRILIVAEAGANADEEELLAVLSAANPATVALISKITKDLEEWRVSAERRGGARR